VTENSGFAPSRPAPLADAAIEERLRRNFGRARWFLAPIYFGLLATLLVLAVKFVQKLIELAGDFLYDSSTETVVDVLQLVDVALVGNLVLLVIFFRLAECHRSITAGALLGVYRPAIQRAETITDLLGRRHRRDPDS
jgi:Uncharacterized protein family, UPF0114